MHAQKDGAHDLLQRLEDNLDAFSPAERTIANFILTNRGGIAFETANSIAEKLQVSPVTVGRFSRKMGYRHFKDLKAGLRTAMSGVPWLVGDQMTAFVGAGGGGDHRGGSLELELAGWRKPPGGKRSSHCWRAAGACMSPASRPSAASR